MTATATTEQHGNGGLPLPNVRATCELSFHGAAANSFPHSLLWVRAPPAAAVAETGDGRLGPDSHDGGPDDLLSSPSCEKSTELVDTIIYASSGVISLATSYECRSNTITSVDSTLVTRTSDRSSSPDGNGAATTKRVLARGEAVEDAAAFRSVTALAWVENDVDGKNLENNTDSKSGLFGIAAAFSDGTVTSWRYNNRRGWNEHVLVGHDPESTTCRRHIEDGVDWSDLNESIADVSAANIDDENGASWLVATASSKGIFVHLSTVNDGAYEAVSSRKIHRYASASLQFQRLMRNGGGGRGDDETTQSECYLFAGSASPRHNKVWVYTIPCHFENNSDGNGEVLGLFTIGDPLYHGHLLGHQDWITCFSWLDQFTSTDDNRGERKESLLASSGHDAKIRLWKFSSRVSSARDEGVLEDEGGSDVDENSDDEDEAIVDDLEEDEGEARLIVAHAAAAGFATVTTAVSLEALLLGHEEAVTSLAWRRQNGGESPCLLSSSMDRTILLWMEEEHSTEEGGTGGGVWVPISRVGSAGGILGGSVGASLMGFVDATFSPDSSNNTEEREPRHRIVGHGYGGSIHFWTQDRPEQKAAEIENEAEMEEDSLLSARWVADPCITGHFQPVVDMAWDPSGEYLLTTSSDQTTRLWTEVPISETQCRWVEVGRPQVHGYDMTSIVCIGGKSNDNSINTEEGEPRHRFVSGADEKILRVFDAPISTLRMLVSIKQLQIPGKGSAVPSEGESVENQSASWRVERAFLPSLGLSNKATADVDQESSKYAGPASNDNVLAHTSDTVDKSAKLKLPSERDLGVTTLWPEARKLFGHESELVCLDAYRGRVLGVTDGLTTLVASSCKARNDVASAAIRLWDCKKGKCVGILKGGHRSTVSTMSFSLDGKYLASSGKDRRICIWNRANNDISDDGAGYELSAAVDGAHKRIVWSLHFCPNAPGILASGSRDGLVKVWRISEEADGSLETKELFRFEPATKCGKSPITAVAFADDLLKGSNGSSIDYGILSIGTKSGRIEVWAVPISSSMNTSHKPALIRAIPYNDSHFDTVKKVAWRPTIFRENGLNGEGSMHLTLATCGQDNGVRIFKLMIKNESVV